MARHGNVNACLKLMHLNPEALSTGGNDMDSGKVTRTTFSMMYSVSSASDVVRKDGL